MFISTAYAQTAAAAGVNTETMMSFLPLLLMVAVFYFLVIRPQSKRAQEHTKMLDTLRRGDKVLTTGGFHASIKKVEEDGTLTVELSEGVVATLDKSSVVNVLIRASEASATKVKAKAGKKASK